MPDESAERSAPLADLTEERLVGDALAKSEETSPCLRCEWPLPVRLMGCHGGRCPNCGHNYPHGDCSD